MTQINLEGQVFEIIVTIELAMQFKMISASLEGCGIDLSAQQRITIPYMAKFLHRVTATAIESQPVSTDALRALVGVDELIARDTSVGHGGLLDLIVSTYNRLVNEVCAAVYAYLTKLAQGTDRHTRLADA